MPKIIYSENIQKLKEQLETGNTLVDYFFICGISPSLCTNEILYKITSKKKFGNFEGNFKAKNTM